MAGEVEESQSSDHQHITRNACSPSGSTHFQYLIELQSFKHFPKIIDGRSQQSYRQESY